MTGLGKLPISVSCQNRTAALLRKAKKSRLAEKFGFGAPAVMVEGADFFAGWSNKSGVADF